ncbi:serine hydrolase, partial [Acinetobacter baumannii]
MSDNDAYNRLYEFLGQRTINEQLHKKGYGDVRITRRFVTMDEVQNRHTNAIRFMENNKTIYAQPAAYSDFVFDYPQP